MRFRFDRIRSVWGVIIYVRDNIPSKHKLPDDIEGIFIEVNLRKTNWFISPSQSVQNFFKHVSYALGTYKQTYEKIFLADGFNTDDTEL